MHTREYTLAHTQRRVLECTQRRVILGVHSQSCTLRGVALLSLPPRVCPAKADPAPAASLGCLLPVRMQVVSVRRCTCTRTGGAHTCWLQKIYIYLACCAYSTPLVISIAHISAAGGEGEREREGGGGKGGREGGRSFLHICSLGLPMDRSITGPGYGQSLGGCWSNRETRVSRCTRSASEL